MPLTETPLNSLQCDFRRERDADILRAITTLETIDDVPARKFWQQADKKQSSQDDSSAKAFPPGGLS